MCDGMPSICAEKLSSVQSENQISIDNRVEPATGRFWTPMEARSRVWQLLERARRKCGKNNQCPCVVHRAHNGHSANSSHGTNMTRSSILVLLGGLVFSSLALSQTCNYVGGTRFCSNSDGTSFTANTLGGTTYINRSDGSSSTVNQLGGTTFQNNSNGTSSTANTLGGTTFINRSDGSSATVNRMGGTTFINGSDGSSKTCNTIGGTLFCN